MFSITCHAAYRKGQLGQAKRYTTLNCSGRGLPESEVVLAGADIRRIDAGAAGQQICDPLPHAERQMRRRGCVDGRDGVLMLVGWKSKGGGFVVSTDACGERVSQCL